LPAVVSSVEWLRTYPRLRAGLNRVWRLPLVQTKPAGWMLILAAAAGLIGIALWPDYLFPLVWTAPLILIIGLQLAMGDDPLIAPAAKGDWRLLWLGALGGLLCGFLWELWNFHSLAHWEYAIPFVHRLQVFEMPLLGYAGYLPFGLECLAIVQLVYPELVASLQDEDALPASQPPDALVGRDHQTNRGFHGQTL
jgi:hypothetical protein